MKTSFAPYAIAVAVSLLPAAGLLPAAQPPALQLELAPPGIANEFSATPELTWMAEAGVNYVIQTSTNLANPAAWRSVDVAKSSGTIRWSGTDFEGATKYYRVFTQPQITDVQPAFINSEDPGALLYLSGQLLPTNGIVVINGQSYSGATDSNGVLSVSLNGLPPGTPITGTISVLDAASNVVATLAVQSPIYYSTTMPSELLQGPPEEPPASPDGIKFQARSKQSEAKLNSKAMFTIQSPKVRKPGVDSQLDSPDVSALKANTLSVLSIGGPVASPFYLAKKGYDYYQAKSQLSFAGLQNNPYFKDNDNQGEMPTALKAKEKANQTKCGSNIKQLGLVAVRPATGELQCEATDLAIPGAMLDFAWTRTYRSRTGPATAQGAGWDFSYNVSLTQNGDGTITLRPGNGRADTFYPHGTNWVRDEYFCEVRDLDSDGYPDVLFADTGKWLFTPTGPAAGKLRQIVDRNGNAISLNYDTTGNLATIVDDLGRTNSVGYDTSGRISSVTDFTGRSVRYEYNTAGDLERVISPPTTDFPGGITNRYTYSSGFPPALDRLNHNLTSCIDGKGQTQLEITYSPTNNPASIAFDTVTATQHGDKWATASNWQGGVIPQSGAHKVIIRDPVGNVTEEFYDSRQRCVRRLEYTGRAPDLNSPTTETANRPANKLRAEDPEYFETTLTWNRDSLCTEETLPDGQRTRFIYESDFNAQSSPRKKGDCRVVRALAAPGGGADLDGDGVNDITELAWHFDYDPRFGSPPSDYNKYQAKARQTEAKISLAAAMRGGPIKGLEVCTGGHKPGSDKLIVPTVTGHAINTKGMGANGGFVAPQPGGNDYRTTAGKTVKRTDNVCAPIPGDGFIISATDPRGNVTTAEYDPSGNCYKTRKVQNNDNPHKFAYSPLGQLTAITNAPDANGFSRVDTFSYYTNGPMAGQLQSVVIDDRDLIGLKEYHAFEYDAVGNLTRYIVPRTNDWLYTYNALDQCVRVQSPVNLTVRGQTDFIYDANGNVQDAIEELQDASDAFVHNVTTHFAYDDLDNCTAVAEQVSAGGFITNRFEYDANDNLVAILSPLAVSGADSHAAVAFEYDERGLLFRQIAAPGSPLQNTDQLDYDVNGNVTRVSEGLEGTPSVTTLAYDGFGSSGSSSLNAIRKELVKHLGLVNFSSSVRCSRVTDPMGNETRFNYDRNGNCTLVRCYGETNDLPGGAGNILLAQTSYKYDRRDQMVKCTTSHFRTSGAPVGDGTAVTTFAYAPNGACTNITDDNGVATTYDYDAAGRVYLVKTPRTVVQTQRNVGGNVTSIIQTDTPDGSGPTQQFSVSYSYDSLGRCISAADNVGNTNRYAYDSLGRLTRETNPRGVTTGAEFDDCGRGLKLWVDKNGDGTMSAGELQSLRTYNANSQIVAIADANTNITRYAYDSIGNCTAVTNADNTVIKLVWSPRSNLIVAEDANGTTITNTYDLCERIVHRDIAARGGAAATTTFEIFGYDGLSRCALASNDVSRATFEFDSMGNCVRSSQDGRVCTSTFDGVGNCLSMTYPSGRVVTATYNSVDDLASISSSAGGGLPPVTLATYAYAGPGRVSRVTHGNGLVTDLTWNGLASPQNAPDDFGSGQVSSYKFSNGNGDKIKLYRSAYSRTGNLVSRENAFSPGGTASLVMSTNLFSYDALDRLTDFARLGGAMNDIVRSYQLDANGNRQFSFSNGVAQAYAMDTTLPPGDFQMNQYTVTPFGAQLFDENGNLAARGTAGSATQYVYDYADRLVLVNDLGTGTPKPVTAYAYDALGRCIGKTLFSTNPVIQPVTTELVHDGSDCDDTDPIEEFENGLSARTFVLPHVFEQKSGKLRKARGFPHVYDQNFPGPKKGRVMFSGTGDPYHLHCDDLGNALALTDAGGNVVERYDYDDFGAPTFLAPDGSLKTGSDGVSPAKVSEFGMSRLFRGMEWEDAIGLYRCEGNPLFEGGNAGQNPLYDPQTGRATRGKVKNVKDMGGSLLIDGNPWSLKKEEGGRHTPFQNRSVLKTYFETGDIPTQQLRTGIEGLNQSKRARLFNLGLKG